MSWPPTLPSHLTRCPQEGHVIDRLRPHVTGAREADFAKRGHGSRHCRCFRCIACSRGSPCWASSSSPCGYCFVTGSPTATCWVSVRRGRRFLRRAGLGLVAGAGLMKLALLPLFLLQVRVWNEQAPGDWMGWITPVLGGLGQRCRGGIDRGDLLRGAMQGALQRIGATRWALFAVPVLYAAVHFLGRAASVPDEGVDAWSGFVALGGFFTSYRAAAGHPRCLRRAVVRGAAAGAGAKTLGRHRGLHRTCTRASLPSSRCSARFLRPRRVNDWSFLVGSFDGLLGWWIALLTALACIAVWRGRSFPLRA